MDLVVTDADGNEIGSDIAQERDITREDDAGGISGLGASFSSSDPVEAGVYYVSVQGGTNGDKENSTADLAGGWDRYGSLGNYTVTAEAVPGVSPVDITAPEDGAEVPQDGVVVEGTGDSDGSVTLDVDGEQAGEADVDDDGNWSAETGDLEAGERTITATQAVEGAEATTDSVTVTVVEDDGEPDVEPVNITAPEDGAEVSPSGAAVEGSGEPGGTVTPDVDGDEAGQADVDDDGNWSTETGDLEPGERTITASLHVALAIYTTDSVTVTVVEDDGEPDVEPVNITAPEDGAEVSPSGAAVEGSGEPGGTVTLDVDGEEAGQADVDDDGNWSAETGELETGERTITATQAVEGAEATTDSVTVTVVEDDGEPDVEPVNIAAPEDGAEVSPSGAAVEGSGEPGGTVTLDVDGEEAGQADVDDDGNWSAETGELETG